jgi:uncharacterized protein (TIGR03067 family)
MQFCIAMLLMAGFITAVDDPATGTKDEEALQGLWQAVELEHGGEKAPAEAVTKFQIRIKGNKIIFNPDTEKREHTFELDPKTNPKAMDLTPSDGPAKSQKLPCAIYKLDGDKLTICLDKEAKTGKRPAQFKTAAGDGFALLKFERVKEKK